MTPTAQEVAEQVFNEVSTTRCPHDTEIFVLEQNCTICLMNALLAFAHARERAVWEQAASVVEHWVNESGPLRQQLAEEFRRRSTGGRDD